MITFLDVEKPELKECRILVNGSQGYINSTTVDDLKNQTSNYSIPLDCMWIITVKPGWKVLYHFNLKQLYRVGSSDLLPHL